jgi:hypothetical protein
MHDITSPTLRELFDACLDMPPAERAAFLHARCADANLRDRIERLLHADARDDRLFDGGAQAAAQMIGESEMRLPAGSRVGAFEIVRMLGEGGSSTVFVAQRESDGVRQQVALKILSRGLYSVDAQKQFRRERTALAQLTHPGIARLIEGGVTENGVAYIALEHVDGAPITAYVRERRLDMRERLALFVQVCRAVEAAHRALIVHRDLKPSNVLVNAEGSVKLLDFGIAKLLQSDDEEHTRSPMLTPAYAAPEQHANGPITTATDVYALGVLLGELVTGRRLNGADTATPSSRIADDAADGTLPDTPAQTRRTVRGDLDNILRKSLDAQPERRYASAGAFADDVDRWLDGKPVAAHPPSAWYRARKFVRRHRGGVAMTLVFLLAMITAFAVALWQANLAREQARNAEQQAARANATKDFLIRVFRASDPRIAQDKPRGQVTAKELLDLNAPAIERNFANDPDTQIELLGVAATIYRELDDQPRYSALHAQQVELARKIYGDAHPAIIQGLIDDANHANDRNDYAQARDLLQRADALIHRAALDRSVIRARWFLARSHVLATDDASANAAGDALDGAAKLYAEVAPHDAGYVSALTSMGFRQLRQNGGAEAEPWFRRAIAAAETDSDRDDAQLQQFAYPGLAAALEFQGKFDESELAYQHSAELARKTYGESHSTYWVSAAEFASLVHRQGERDRAHALFADLFKAIPQPWDADSYDDYAREFYAACLVAEGRSQEAIPLLEASLRTYLAKPSVEYELRRIRLILGDAYDQVGRGDEARPMLKSSLDERIAKDPPDAGTVRAARERWGRFLFSHADSAGAEEQFRLVLANEHGRNFATFAMAHGDLANVFLERGDTGNALAESRHAVESFEHVTGRRDVRVGPFLWLIHAEALRRSGEAAQARDWAQRALDASRKYDAPDAPSIKLAEAALHRRGS